ncbi:hypothetical protein [Vibrio splendidus]|uniref:hypothetical protein n=1 Tax=Vibrio splendidus TaxID=29497 RepID=UPI002468C98B|nr:hypothetical protein [Vibrio splendidus]MDH6024945.1 hypothetical protein [Vibrio splendidus]
MINSEESTQLLRKSLNFLFVANKQGTSLGVVLGLASQGTIGFLMPTLKTIAGVDFEAIKVWHLMCFWVFIFNIKPYFNRHKPDPKIEAAINQIKQMETNGQITKAQAKLQYYELSQRVLSSVTIDTKPLTESQAE